MYGSQSSHPAAVGGSASSSQSAVEFTDMDDYPTLFCRALYDYDAQDASALSFRRGDIIEVLTQQASGWWDGLLGEERGWFPSNYVTIVSDEEAEMAFSGSDPDVGGTTNGHGHHQSRHSIVDMSHALMRGSQEENEDWLDNELSDGRGGMDELATSVWDSGTSSSDFWMPQVAPNGQIFYVNTQTGQQSRDLPQEHDDDISDTDLGALTAQAATRAGTNTSLAFGPDAAYEAAHSDSDVDGPVPGFGLPRRSGTPDPWIKKLADDGLSYYYLNTTDGQVSWTKPEVPSRTAKRPTDAPVPPASTSRLQPAVSNNTNRLSVYSDSSDIIDPSMSTRPPPLNGDNRSTAPSEPQEPYVDTLVMELTAAERIAQSLQHSMAPPPPKLLTDLSALVKNSIQDVVDNIQRGDILQRSDEDDTMEKLVNAVVLSVRNLLYVSAAPTGSIPNNVLPASARVTNPPPSNSVLKPAQRKVTATLSRLVLSARAMQYESGQSTTETLGRIEVDADELERAVLAFVLEVQRVQHSGTSDKPLKRLNGYFGTANLGLGLPGAGSAGSWQGFGWVVTDSKAGQTLSPEVLAESSQRLTQLDALFTQYEESLRSSDITTVILQSRDVVSQLSSYVTFASNIHIARHVDIDGIRQESNHRPNDAYIQTVSNARSLVRALECFVQAVYDDGAAFLDMVQTWHSAEIAPHRLSTEVDSLFNSLNDNLVSVQETLNFLLAIGREQAELGQAEYGENIRRRLSRLSLIEARFGGDHGKRPETISEDLESVVDMDYAFSKPPMPSKASGSTGNGSSQHHHKNQASVARSVATDPTVIGDDDVDSVFANDEVNPFDDDAPRMQPKGRQKDLTKLFGPGFTSDQPPVPEVPEVPWYLRPNYNPEEILIDSDNSIKGGTIPALVERLTAHEFSDPTYVKTFMMTFKSFTTVQELFNLLVERFRTQPPPELTPKELEDWAKLKQHIIQMRVLNIVKTMVLDEEILDREDMFILEQIKQFAMSDEVSHFAAAKQLLLHIERAQRGSDRARIIPVNLSQAPPPIIPKANKGGKLKLLDIEPLEMARQLTIMESTLFQRIKPIECLQRAREQKTETQDNITVCIHASNRIADWVADSVLNKDDARRRANNVKHLISIADRCRTLNNFSTMIAITSGLNTPPIRRLKRTWEQVSQRYMAQFGACEMTIDSNKNFTKYRQLMATVTPPCVPFIGVFLSTLQFIQDGNPDTLPGGLVNFRKRQRASEVISDIQRWQAQSFNFQTVPSIQAYIEESLSRFNDTTKATSDMFWALSLEREPREREDEKMARLLQESGFL